MIIRNYSTIQRAFFAFRRIGFATTFAIVFLLGPAYYGAAQSTKAPPLLEQWRQTIEYGINSQILDLIHTLKNQNDGRLNKELTDLFKTSYDQKLQSAIIDLFTSLSYQGAEIPVRDYLAGNPDNSALVTSCLSYLAHAVKHPEKETVQTIISYTKNENDQLAGAAIRDVGDIAKRDGPDSYDFSGFLHTIIQKLQADGTSQGMMENIILTLGDLKAKQAVDPLIAILNDTQRPATLRDYAADSLGRIGDPKAIPAISGLLKTDNAILRAYVVNAMSHFDTPEVNPMLMQALRDSYARVRSAALDGVRRNKLTEAIPAVIFKAEHDPDPHVQLDAISTLGSLGTNQCWDALRSIFENGNISLDRRKAALEELLKGDLGASMGAIRKVITENWGLNGEQMLGTTAKVLSTTKAQQLKDIYAKLITHPNPIIQLYAMRGIALNGMSDLKKEIEKFNTPTAPAYLKREAQQTLNELGGTSAVGGASAAGGTTQNSSKPRN